MDVKCQECGQKVWTWTGPKSWHYECWMAYKARKAEKKTGKQGRMALA